MASSSWTADQFLFTLRRGVMPCTVGFVQKRTGLAEHRARRIRNDLVRRQLLIPIGFYRGRGHGYRVTLYRVVQPAASVTSSVRRNATVKRRCSRRNWWRHALFGTHDGKPIPRRLR